MFIKAHLRTIVIVSCTVLLVVAGLFVRSSLSGSKNGQKMMTVGGKENPCQCTQRLER